MEVKREFLEILVLEGELLTWFMKRSTHAFGFWDQYKKCEERENKRGGFFVLLKRNIPGAEKGKKVHFLF